MTSFRYALTRYSPISGAAASSDPPSPWSVASLPSHRAAVATRVGAGDEGAALGIDEYHLGMAAPAERAGVAQIAQLGWWRARLGLYLLADVTPALIVECKDELLREPVRT